MQSSTDTFHGWNELSPRRKQHLFLHREVPINAKNELLSWDVTIVH